MTIRVRVGITVRATCVDQRHRCRHPVTTAISAAEPIAIGVFEPIAIMGALIAIVGEPIAIDAVEHIAIGVEPICARRVEGA